MAPLFSCHNLSPIKVSVFKNYIHDLGIHNINSIVHTINLVRDKIPKFRPLPNFLLKNGE